MGLWDMARWRVYLSIYGGTGMSGISINGRALEMLSCTWLGRYGAETWITIAINDFNTRPSALSAIGAQDCL